MKERDEVLVRGHIVSINGNHANVSWNSTTFAYDVPMSKMIELHGLCEMAWVANNALAPPLGPIEEVTNLLRALGYERKP